MSLCSFLSTTREKVECFKTCAFYKYEDNNGECPFNDLVNFKKDNTKNDYDDYYLEEEDDIFVFEGELERVEI